ncbi:MAG TPA: hypothetical protein VE201_03390, partial [Nitrospirales bacterium]|nr:hypothetical protein [Nitrospirales bacterium]
MADHLAPSPDRDEEPLLAVHPRIPWVQYALIFIGLSSLAVIPPLLKLRRSYWDPFDTEVYFALCGVVLACFLLFGLRLFLVSRLSLLRVDRAGLVFVNALGLRRSLARQHLGKVVIASVEVMRLKYRMTFTYCLFLDQEGRTLLKLPAKWWPEEEIEGLGRELGVLVTGTFGSLDGPAFRRQYPGSIPWIFANPMLTHPALIVLLGTGLLFAALVVVIILAAMLTGH